MGVGITLCISIIITHCCWLPALATGNLILDSHGVSAPFGDANLKDIPNLIAGLVEAADSFLDLSESYRNATLGIWETLDKVNDSSQILVLRELSEQLLGASLHVRRVREILSEITGSDYTYRVGTNVTTKERRVLSKATDSCDDEDLLPPCDCCDCV